MTATLVEWFGLPPDDQHRASALAGRIKSLAELLKDAADSVNASEIPARIAEACPWWLGAAGEALAKSAPPVKFVAEFVRAATEVRDPDKLAWLACTAAFQRATELAFKAVGPPTGPRLGAEWKPPADALKVPVGVSFDTLSLTNLFAHPFMRESMALVDQAAQAMNYDDTSRLRLLREVRMRCAGELKRVLTHPDTRARFAAVAERVRLEDEDARVSEAWRTHADYQRRLFEEAPVFGDEPFALADIYTPTECGKLTWGTIAAASRDRAVVPASALPAGHAAGPLNPFDEQHGGRRDLLDTVMELIGDPTFRDAIVIQGPAGSGKSAFTLRLAVELLREGLTPIRVRLRDMALTMRNIDEAIPDATRFSEDVDASGYVLTGTRDLFLGGRLFEEAIPFGNARICPYVLIFDGWDEVSVSAARGFFEQIDYLLGQIRDRFLNRPSRPVIRVVLTGRPSDAIPRSAFLKQSTCILTIRSSRPETLEAQTRRLVDVRTKRAAPSAEVLNLEPMLDAYRQGFDGGPLSDQFMTRKTLDLLGLPLLAHLAVRLLMQTGMKVTDVVQSQTTLYRLLIDHTCASGTFGEGVAERSIRPPRLRQLLQQTAAAMTIYGRDSIPYGELEQRLADLFPELLDEVREIDRDNPISGLVISFFFKGGQRELGAEFTHKSFREYLTAEAVIEALKEYGRTADPDLAERARGDYWRDFESHDPRHGFSRVLGRLLSAQWIVPEVAAHLKGLIEWELQRSRVPESSPPARAYRTEPIELEHWRRVRDGLADLWDWWAEGVHLRPQPKVHGRRFDGLEAPYVQELIDWHIFQDRSQRDYEPSVPRTTTIDAVFGDALCRLAALVHCHVAGGLDANWRSADDGEAPPARPRRYQSWARVDDRWERRFKPTGEDRNYFRSYCFRINAGGTRPRALFPALVDFAGADLRQAGLPRTTLIGCSFQGADLHEADLEQSYIENTVFSGADLTSAQMSQCTLVVATLERADLRGANAQYAKFVACNLTHTNVAGADLSYGCVLDSQITSCNLAEAKREGTRILSAGSAASTTG